MKCLHAREFACQQGVATAPLCINIIFIHKGCICAKEAAHGLLQVKTVGDIMTLEPAAGSTATVLVADLSACKAVVHIIDTILIPKAVSPEPSVSCNLCIDRHQLNKLTLKPFSVCYCT